MKKYASEFFIFVYALILVFGMYFHEMWRDEFQAYLISLHSHSFMELYENTRYEGQPIVWHTLLYLLTSITSNIVSMQIFHVFIAIVTAYVFMKFSPFSFSIKALFLSGYFMLYEYAIISRPYAVGLFLIFLFCLFYEKYLSNRNAKMVLILSCVLFVLANTSIFGLIFSSGFTLLIFMNAFVDYSKEKFANQDLKGLIFILLFALSGIIIALLQAVPPNDHSLPVSLANGFDVKSFKHTLSSVITSFIPLHDFTSIHFWSSTFFDKSAFLTISLSVLLFFASVLFFIRKPGILIVYILISFAILFFCYHTFKFDARYRGHLFIAFWVCMWISFYYPLEFNPFKKSISEKYLKKITNVFLICILFFQSVSAAYAYYMEYRYPFSNIISAGEYITENNLNGIQSVGALDFLTSPLSYYTGVPMYFPVRYEAGNFIKWDKKRTKGPLGLDKTIEQIKDKMRKGENRLLLIFTEKLQITLGASKIDFVDGYMGSGIRVQHLRSFDEKSIDPHEKYYIYLAVREN